MNAPVCQFWDCAIRVRPGHFLCYDHFVAWEDRLLDKCRACGRFIDAQYDLCLDCYRRHPSANRGSSQPRGRYEPEYSPAWEAEDEAADEFYVYILKLDDAKFYAGQTRDLRARLSEHRDGKVKSTAGRNPKLQWFLSVPTREIATDIEADLKRLIDKNPREVRRLIIKFRDLTRELDQ